MTPVYAGGVTAAFGLAKFTGDGFRLQCSAAANKPGFLNDEFSFLLKNRWDAKIYTEISYVLTSHRLLRHLSIIIR